MVDGPLQRIVENRRQAVAKALREHQMAGRITREWGQVPNSDKRKWLDLADVAIDAFKNFGAP